MRELREANRHDGRGEHGITERPEIGDRLLEDLAVVEPGHDHHLAVKLDSARRQPRELAHDIRHLRVVEQNLSRLERRRVHGDVEGRQPVLEDARDVLVLHVRQRREVAVGEGEPVVVVANVQRRAEPLRQPLDETELALVAAAAHARRLEHDAHRHSLGALDLENELLTLGGGELEHELLVRGEELPVEKVLELAPIHRAQRGAGDNAELGCDGVWKDARDFDHRVRNVRCEKGHRNSRRAERSSERRTRQLLNMM